MTIRLLSDQLASQIAAGEVVERPFSVVKELLENAIDAGARKINVDIREGGRRAIQVADDGHGIPADQIETAFLRHATSKLQDADGLSDIHTLGFRGEALAAIAAVSNLTVISRATGETAGVRLVMDGGIKASRDTVGAPQGTIISVENLFYNMPARLKFLKSTGTEKRLIDEFVTRYALAYPNVRFRLTHNGRVTFQTSGSGLEEALIAVYGAETARDLLPLAADDAPDGKDRPISVTGYAATPSRHWSNRSRMTLFVNGRWVRDSSLTYAVTQAYHTLLQVGRFPIALIFITMPTDMVDVNVHPAKTEVRFRQPNAVFGAVQKTVRRTLVADSPIRDAGGWTVGANINVGVQQRDPIGWAGKIEPIHNPQSALDLEWRGQGDALPTPSSADEPSQQHIPNLGGEKLPIMRVVGQVGAAYIITEGPDGMYLLDQHAAHERILYEKFMAERDRDGIASQQLMVGTAVNLSPPHADLLSENLETLNKIGFVVEPFGPNAFMVRAVPAVISKLDPTRAVTAVIEDLEQGDAPLQGKIEDKIILRVCKSAAVKAGQVLSHAEMEAMVQQLEASHSPHTCPHGRPTLIHLSVAQLAKQFGRI